MNAFEQHLERLQGQAPVHIRDALIEVADTAHACRLWFESEGLEPTAAAVIAMTELVLERADLNGVEWGNVE